MLQVIHLSRLLERKPNSLWEGESKGQREGGREGSKVFLLWFVNFDMWEVE